MMCARLAAPIVLALCACGPTQFAVVNVIVREPAGKTRLHDEISTLAVLKDGEKANERSFDPNVTPESKPIDLGAAGASLVVTLSTGAGAPTALGRSDAAVVPPIGKSGEGDVKIDVPMLLARPNVPEALDTGIPSARTGVAACDDGTGVAWVVGGVLNTALTNAYTFTLDKLKANDAFSFTPSVLASTEPIACDGDGNGGVLVYEPGAGKLTFDASGTPKPATFLTSTGASAFVRAIDGVVWAASDDVAVLLNPDTRKTIAVGAFSARVGAHFVALDHNHLVRGNADGIDLIGVDGADLVIVDTQDVNDFRGAGFVGADPNSNVMARVNTEDGALFIVRPQVAVGGAGAQIDVRTGERGIDLKGIVPDALLVLPDGRVVGMQHVAGGDSLIDVEGSAPVAANREQMALTVGGAVILFGCAHDCGTTGADGIVAGAGHDVLVAE